MLPISVVLLGGDELLREGLKRVLEDRSFMVIASEHDHTALLRHRSHDLTQSMIVMIDTEDRDLGICDDLRRSFPLVRIVVLADDISLEKVTAAFASGVDGYIARAIGCEPLAGSLRLVAMGEKVLPSQIVDLLSVSRRSAEEPAASQDGWGPDVSKREIEVLRCLVDGHSNKLIARQLAITEATVKVYIKAILRKLGVINRTQAALWAIERGLDRQALAIRHMTTDCHITQH